MLNEKVQQGLEARTTITDKCPKMKPCAESVFHPANIYAKWKAGTILSCLQPLVEYPRACAWHTVLVGLNLDVFESPSAEEGFERKSPKTFLSTFLKS